MRLLIVQSPGVHDVEWRDSIREAAYQKEILLFEEWSGGYGDYPEDKDFILLTDNPFMANYIQPDEVIILIDDLNNISDTYSDRLNVPDKGYIFASKWLSNVLPLVNNGAIVLEAYRSTLNIGILGELSINKDCAFVPKEITGPLLMFKDIKSGNKHSYSMNLPDFYVDESKSNKFNKSEELISLSGRCKHILLGPMTYVPTGKYKAIFEFEVDAEGVKPNLMFSWGAYDRLESLEQEFESSGKYEIDITYEVEETTQVSFHIFVSKPSFAGTLKFVSFKVVCL